MTKTERRIEIIKDAILQLETGIYKTGEYGYIYISSSINTDLEDVQAQSYLCNLSTKEFCGVCAKGSLFLSTIRKENDFLLSDLKDNYVILMKRLNKDNLFEEENLNLIEAYYENITIYKCNLFSYGWVLHFYYCDFVVVAYLGSRVSELEAENFAIEHNNKISKLVEQYPEGKGRDRTPRLLAILNNMLENEGVFKP